MKHLCYSLTGLIFLVTTGHAAPVLTKNSYWQCITEDKTNKQWTARNAYQKMALNIAYEACKKESPYPLSCKTSQASCDPIVRGRSIKPMWLCTALDSSALPWSSNLYTQRDDAALAAKAYCRENSNIPETCYVNMITCRNVNAGVAW